MKVKDFAFNYVEKLHFKCHEKSLNRGSSYVEWPHQVKKRKRYHLITRNKHSGAINVNGIFDINTLSAKVVII